MFLKSMNHAESEDNTKIVLPEREPKDNPCKADFERVSTEGEHYDVILPDGGWGWLVVLGGFCNTAMAGLLVPTFSLIFASVLIDNKVSSTTAGWIFNTNQFFWNMSAVLGGPLISQFGWRKVSFCGGLILSLSIIVSGFVTKPEYLFVTFSFFTGLGQGLIVVVSFVIVPNYFDKRKGFATGITTAGNCAGQFLGPLIVNFLLEHYGYKGTTLILGGILSHTCVSSMLFHPVKWHYGNRRTKSRDDKQIQLLLEGNVSTNFEFEKRRGSQNSIIIHEITKGDSKSFTDVYNGNRSSSSLSLERISSAKETNCSFYINNFPRTMNKPSSSLFSQDEEAVCEEISNVFNLIVTNLLLLKWRRAQIIAMTASLSLASYINFVMIVPFAMAEESHSLEMVSWCLSAAGLCNLISRLIITTLTDFVPFSTKYFFMAGSFGIFITIFIFTMVSSSKLILLTMCVFGVSVGSCVSMLSLVILEFMGLEFLPQILGLDGLLVAISFFIFGPIFGGIRDVTGSYVITLRILSLAPLLAFFLWFLMPCAISVDKQKQIVSEEKYLNGR